MPQNKNQHYVPRFYLRNFSLDGANISSFLIESEKSLPNVSITNQCSKDYFYPNLQYEQNLGKFEEQCSTIIDDIVSDQKTTTLSKKDSFWLRAFTILQKSRTLHQARILKDSFNDIIEYLRSSGMTEEMKSQIEGYDNSYRSAAALLANTFRTGMEISSDLCCKVLSFTCRGALLTSDDPVVMYNPFLEGRGKLSYGLAAMGLVLFLPLSDRHAVVLYDGDTYKIGQRKERIVELSNPDDIGWLNLLTILNADKAVYFKPGTKDPYSLALLTKRAKAIGQSKGTKFMPLEAKDGNSELLYSREENFYIGAKFSFLKTIDKAKSIRFGDTIGAMDYSRPFCNAWLMSQPQQPPSKIPEMSYRPKK